MNLIRKKLKPALHLAFWLLFFVLLSRLAGRFLPLPKAAAGSFVAVLVLAGVAYANAMVVIPRFFKKGKFGWYALSMAGLLAVCMLVNLTLIHILRNGEQLAVSPGRKGLLPVFFLTLAVLFASTVYALAKQFLEKERLAVRLEKEVQKAHEQLESKQPPLSSDVHQSFENQFIIIKQGYDHHKVFLKDIIFIAALREYSQYHTRQGKFMELKPISQVEKELPGGRFIRIHRSHIVARSAVSGQVGNDVMLENGTQLPMGKTYRQEVLQQLF